MVQDDDDAGCLPPFADDAGRKGTGQTKRSPFKTNGIFLCFVADEKYVDIVGYEAVRRPYREERRRKAQLQTSYRPLRCNLGEKRYGGTKSSNFPPVLAHIRLGHLF